MCSWKRKPFWHSSCYCGMFDGMLEHMGKQTRNTTSWRSTMASQHMEQFQRKSNEHSASAALTGHPKGINSENTATTCFDAEEERFSCGSADLILESSICTA